MTDQANHATSDGNNAATLPGSVRGGKRAFVHTGSSSNTPPASPAAISICDPLLPGPDPELLAQTDGRRVGLPVPGSGGLPDTAPT